MRKQKHKRLHGAEGIMLMICILFQSVPCRAEELFAPEDYTSVRWGNKYNLDMFWECAVSRHDGGRIPKSGSPPFKESSQLTKNERCKTPFVFYEQICKPGSVVYGNLSWRQVALHVLRHPSGPPDQRIHPNRCCIG